MNQQTAGTESLGRWNVVIAGAGSAGCILASRLTEDPGRSVLLVEAGPDFPPPIGWPREITHGGTFEVGDYLMLFDGRYTESQGPVFVPRGRVVGGSGSVNGGIFFRGIQEDYDSWGSPLWTHREVERFFKKIETDLDFPDRPIHGSTGPIPVKRVQHDAVLPHQTAFHEAVTDFGFGVKEDLAESAGQGIGRIPLNKIGGFRTSAAIGYLDPARDRANLTILPLARVIRVLVNNGTATGILVRQAEETSMIQADLVVLCAGGLMTPHILMHSGIGPAVSLSRLGIPIVCDLPGVGENAHDHPGVGVQVATPERFRPKTSDPAFQMMLVMTSKSTSIRNDMAVYPSFVFEEVIQYRSTMQLPLSVGNLEFLSADPDVLPRIRYHYLEEEIDRTRFRESVRLVIELLDHPALRELGKARLEPQDAELSSDAALDEWIDRELNSAMHTSGTCKLGSPNDPLAVVDDRGRVYGVDRLIIADLSIAPNVARAPANATAMMVGERIADLIANSPADR